MILKRVEPPLELQPYIDTFWLFENDFGVPFEDNRVIAPNGKAKFIYSYINGLSVTDKGSKTDYKDQDIFFIGIWDRPVTLSSHARITGTIGIELTPNGVHRFTNFSASEIANKIFSFADIYGSVGRKIIERLTNTISPTEKINILQNFLIEIVRLTHRHNSIIDYTVSLIKSTSGLVAVKDIERKTGYSKRYLDILFKDHLGISPKTLASIVRFQTFYSAWANTDTDNFYKDNLFDLYFDQAHFIKEFKRYTGFSPKQYANQRNEFGKIFYKR
jgi:AraC-like DNA-binding protein